jgi:hypothetical protein
MNIADLIGTGISSILTGGATGLLGAALQLFFQYKSATLQARVDEVKNAHELLMRDKDLALMQAEQAGRFKVAETEAEAAKSVAADQAFAKSLFAEPERYSDIQHLSQGQQWLLVVLDFARGIVRPGLTLYLCVLTTYIWWQVRQLLSLEDLDASAVLNVWQTVVSTILYLTTTVVLWWFGTRNRQSFPPLIKSS